MDCGRRRLVVATGSRGQGGAVAALVPFVQLASVRTRAKAAGAPVEVDISKLEPGQMMTVEWRGKPVWIINRTKDMLDTCAKLDDAGADPKSEKKQQPNTHRMIPVDQPGNAGRRRYLHAPWLFSVSPSSRRAPKRAWVPTGSAASCALPRFDLRFCRSASSRQNLRRPTSKFRRTTIMADTRIPDRRRQEGA